MNKLTLAATILTLLAKIPDAMAHNEDKPGPHGGNIRMPGGFHTEVLLKRSVLEVYLLDVEIKNPITTNSSLSATWKQKISESELACKSEADKFICDLPKSFNAKKGTLILKAKRDGMIGGLATYELPLLNFLKSKPKKAATDESEHSSHH